MLIVNPVYKDITESAFSPEYWQHRAVPVTTGGRGGAWFVSSDQGEFVLRHYRRGGMMAKVSERTYVFFGQEATRSFREFRLLQTLHQRGLPVPEPVAAMAVRSGLIGYQAAILIRRINSAMPLPEIPDLSQEHVWREVGQTVRRFHDAGLDHVDLNCDNILLGNGRVYLIDFDRCTLRDSGSSAAGWKNGNLKRLRRSVEKRCGALSALEQERLWSVLINSYQGR